MIDKSNFSNFKPTYAGGERMTLPPGVYEGHILAAKLDPSANVPTLVIQVEIDKGEYAGFFRRQYESNQSGQYAARYRGVYRIQLPDGKDAQKDGWRQHQLEGAVWALEDGNPGYKWDWDESRLKGLKTGLNVREHDYYIEGRFGTMTEIGRLESVAQMNDPDESKRPKPMKKRELSDADKKRKAQDEASAAGFVEVESEELPWS